MGKKEERSYQTIDLSIISVLYVFLFLFCGEIEQISAKKLACVFAKLSIISHDEHDLQNALILPFGSLGLEGVHIHLPTPGFEST